MASGKFPIVAVVASLLLITPEIANARTWYSGGEEGPNYMGLDDTCPVAEDPYSSQPDSPAKTYSILRFDGDAKLIDRGDGEVEVTGAGFTYYFFKTKQDCEKYQQRQKQEQEKQEQQQQQFDNRYN